MRAFTAISLLAFLVLLILMPLLFGKLMTASLVKLNLSPGVALLLTVAIIFGGAINVPVKRIEHYQTVTSTRWQYSEWMQFGRSSVRYVARLSSRSTSADASFLRLFPFGNWLI